MRRFLFVLIMAPVLFFVMTAWAEAEMALQEHKTTGSFSELTSELDVSQHGQFYPGVVYSQELTDVKEGELLVVFSDFEVTNENNYNIGLGSQIILSSQSYNTAGTPITDANMFNITHLSHHGVPVKVGSFRMTYSASRIYINVVAWALSTMSSYGDKVKVEPGYGRLIVLRFR